MVLHFLSKTVSHQCVVIYIRVIKLLSTSISCLIPLPSLHLSWLSFHETLENYLEYLLSKENVEIIRKLVNTTKLIRSSS